MAKTPDFGARVQERLKALGYWKNGRPDVGRFSEERGYIPSYVYRWISGETPRGWRLVKLATDLEVDAAWLVPPPQARRKRILACLLAALGLATIPWGETAAGVGIDPRLVAWGVQTSHIMSSARRCLHRWWGRQRAAHTPLRVFPDLTALSATA